MEMIAFMTLLLQLVYFPFSRLWNLPSAFLSPAQSYALGEVSDPEKEAVVRRLWSHTRDVLVGLQTFLHFPSISPLNTLFSFARLQVLVEPGTPRGWQTVLAARQQVLATEKKVIPLIPWIKIQVSACASLDSAAA